MRISFISLALFLVCEACLRLAHVAAPEDLKRIQGELRYYPPIEATQTHPQLEYTSKKNFEGEIVHPTSLKRLYIKTNAEGFRTKPFTKKQATHYRVLLLGDSTIFGEQVSQNKTLAIQLEKFSPQLDVYSLGVSSYSLLRQQVLAKLYFKRLRPDLVILNIDQSDWEEDLKRQHDYIYQNGLPIRLKRAQELIQYTHHKAHMRTDRSLDYHDLGSWVHTLRKFSYSFNLFYQWGKSLGLKRQASDLQRIGEHINSQSAKVIKYSSGTLDSNTLPQYLKEDIMPLSLKAAKKTYLPSFKAVEFISKHCKIIGCELVLLSYPYPWEISIKESIAYQLTHFGHIADLRQREEHFQLIDWLASLYQLEHWNSKDIFSLQKVPLYNLHDPHLNSKGYHFLANFLFTKIKPKLR